MLEIAFSSARERRRIVFSPQNRRARRGRGWKEIPRPSLIYATFSLQIYREPAPIGTWKARNAGFVLMPANFTTLMFDWRNMGDRNNGGCFEVSDNLEGECFPLSGKHTYVSYTFKYLERSNPSSIKYSDIRFAISHFFSFFVCARSTFPRN